MCKLTKVLLSIAVLFIITLNIGFGQATKFYIVPFEMPKRNFEYIENIGTYVSDAVVNKSSEKFIKINTADVATIVEREKFSLSFDKIKDKNSISEEMKKSLKADFLILGKATYEYDEPQYDRKLQNIEIFIKFINLNDKNYLNTNWSSSKKWKLSEFNKGERDSINVLIGEFIVQNKINEREKILSITSAMIKDSTDIELTIKIASSNCLKKEQEFKSIQLYNPTWIKELASSSCIFCKRYKKNAKLYFINFEEKEREWKNCRDNITNLQNKLMIRKSELTEERKKLSYPEPNNNQKKNEVIKIVSDPIDSKIGWETKESILCSGGKKILTIKHENFIKITPDSVYFVRISATLKEEVLKYQEFCKLKKDIKIIEHINIQTPLDKVVIIGPFYRKNDAVLEKQNINRDFPKAYPSAYIIKGKDFSKSAE